MLNSTLIREPNFPSFTKFFSKLKDPRRTSKGNYLYPLDEILFFTICAVVSDAKSWEQIRLFADSKLDWLRKFYPYKNGVPSADVLERLFARLDHQEFGCCFGQWAGQQAGLSATGHVALDGKTVKKSASKPSGLAALHVVSAFMTENRLVLGQTAVGGKGNEIGAITKLLALLDIEGCMVTIDAIGCQKKIVETIRSEKAHYTIQVKGNQKTLLEQTKVAFSATPLASASTQRDFGHGRIETRKCSVVNDLRFVDEKLNWKGLASIVKIERTSIDKQTLKERSQTSYYISSSKMHADEFNQVIRGHWAIENNLHWCLDVLFKEDDSLKRNGSSPNNFNIIAKTALSLIEREPTPKMSKIGKMKRCAYSDQFRENTLFG